MCLGLGQGLFAQRKLPPKSREQKKLEKQVNRKQYKDNEPEIELRWNTHKLMEKSKGYPEISAWHSGTAGIIAADAAEISLFNPTRIGFTRRIELLFRMAEEPFMPNVGLKHAWWGNKRFFLTTAHHLYYTYPGLKILQSSGLKNLIADSLRLGQGIAMRHEILFSWLINPRVWGCPEPPAEKILTFRVGTELYINCKESEVVSFDYAYSLYHTQLLEGKTLFYSGLQFDSYWKNRLHYSMNGIFYSVGCKKDYAVETNLRLTYYVSRHWGISFAGKGASISIGEQTKFVCIPFLDLTYLVRPSRSTIQHGLFKNKKNPRF